MLPNFLGLGAARSGSTWIARNLMVHPDVFLPRAKELHYFDWNWDKGSDYYVQAFSQWSGQRVCGEVTPGYFHDEAVAPRIKECVPDVKLFVSLRNPVDRAYSHYWRLANFSLNDESQDPQSFEEAITKSKDIVEVGYYYKHLERYYQYFDRNQMLVLLYDDLQTNPENFLRQIYRFLEIDDYFHESLVRQKVNSASSLKDLAKSKSLWYFQRLMGRIGLFSITGKIHKLNSTKIPSMRPESRSMLVELYEEPNRRLEEMLKRDLSQWRMI
ncbi:MAG: sulfotransferase family protein [Candidatus Promineifilaceae bacterium]